MGNFLISQGAKIRNETRLNILNFRSCDTNYRSEFSFPLVFPSRDRKEWPLCNFALPPVFNSSLLRDVKWDLSTRISASHDVIEWRSISRISNSESEMLDAHRLPIRNSRASTERSYSHFKHFLVPVASVSAFGFFRELWEKTSFLLSSFVFSLPPQNESGSSHFSSTVRKNPTQDVASFLWPTFDFLEKVHRKTGKKLTTRISDLGKMLVKRKTTSTDTVSYLHTCRIGNDPCRPNHSLNLLEISFEKFEEMTCSTTPPCAYSRENIHFSKVRRIFP